LTLILTLLTLTWH